jgi:hypothetical protein
VLDLKNAVKQVAYWTLPPGVKSLIRAIVHKPAERVPPEEQEILTRNGALRKRHDGQRCFILATGPSIRGQDLKPLRAETCIAVSNFFVHPDYKVIAPRYHCIVPYHLPIPEEAWQSWMDEVEVATGNAAMLFGLRDRMRNQRNGRFSNREVHYLKFGANWDSVTESGMDLTKALPGPQSVPVMALVAAIYMGFREVYLLGCDHNAVQHMGVSRHFYDERQHALNRSGYNPWAGMDVENKLRANLILWQQYKALREVARSLSVCIYNATEGGLLDVFPRRSYERVVGGDAAR